MKRIIALCSALLFFALVLAPRSKADGIFTATLLGSNEVPPNASAATGTAAVSVTGDSLTVSLAFSGLSSPATAAHIQCCASAGTNAPVALVFTGFPAAISGTYTQTFDLTWSSTYSASFVSSSGGTAADAESALLAALSAGMSYVNIHDELYPGGEIRGQLMQSQPTAAPESGVLILLGIGLCLIAGLQRLRPFRTLSFS